MLERKRCDQKEGYFKGAAWIAVGGFLSKLIGALYRIPLTNFIGGYGMGLYQLVYPLYTLLLTVSATGIPAAIARLTAERVGAGMPLRPLFHKTIRLFVLLGGVGSISMLLLAYPLSRAQGAVEVFGGYLTLAPSVLLVSAISVYRGYMQGKNDMFPTAFSEIIEQLVKVGIGMPFAYAYRDNPAKSVPLLLLAVSVAEGVALLFVWLYARKKHSLPLETGERVSAKSIFRASLPVTASAALLPLSGLIDSVLIVRLLMRHTQDAVGLYGLFTGGAVTLVNLPVSVCYGLAAASIPAVAMAVTWKEKRKKIKTAVLSTMAISLPCAVVLFLLAGVAQRLVYPALSAQEAQTLVRLVRIFAISTFLLSCTQTLSACLTALGKPQYGTLAIAVAMVVKTVLSIWWVSNPRFSVYGLAMATNIGYTVAFLLDLYYNIKVTKERPSGDGTETGQRRGHDSCRWFRRKKRRLDRSG